MKWETTIFHIKKCRIRLKDSNQDSEELILGSDVNILIQDPGTKFCLLILLIIWSTDTVNTGKDQNPTLKGEKKKKTLRTGKRKWHGFRSKVQGHAFGD